MNILKSGKAKLSALAIAMTVTAMLTASLPASASYNDNDPQVENDINNALALAGVEPAAPNPDVTFPATSSDPAALQLDSGRLEMTPLFGVGSEYEGADPTRFFEYVPNGVSMAVQSTSSGLRTLLHISDPDAPQNFDFAVGGDVASLQLTEDGGVAGLDANGDLVAAAPAPWAYDTNGEAVPTQYSVNGTTLTLTVSHWQFSHGIVVDPWWNPFSWPWGKWVTKSKKVVSSALKKCGQGALVTTIGLGVGTGTTNVLIEKYGSGIAKIKVGGWQGYVGAAAAGCIVNNL